MKLLAVDIVYWVFESLLFGLGWVDIVRSMEVLGEVGCETSCGVSLPEGCCVWDEVDDVSLPEGCGVWGEVDGV